MNSRDKRITLQAFAQGAKAHKAGIAPLASESVKPEVKPVLSLDFKIGEFVAEDMLLTLIRECAKRGIFTAGIMLDPTHATEPKIFGVGNPAVIRALLAKGADLIESGNVQNVKEIPNKVQ